MRSLIPFEWRRKGFPERSVACDSMQDKINGQNINTKISDIDLRVTREVPFDVTI